MFYSSNYQQLVKLTLYFLPIEQKSPKAAIADLAKDFLNQSPNPEVRLFLVEGNPFLLFSAWPLLVLLSCN